MEMNTKNVFAFIAILIVLLLIAMGVSQLGDGDQQTERVEIESQFPGKIVYTTNVDQDPTPFQNDCRERNGTFNQCGSICEPNAEFCAEVCAFTCEFDEGNDQNFEELNWERYENSEVGFAIYHPFEVDVETVQGGPAAIGETINFSMWGPTQAEATEFFDGISVTIQKESMEDLGASANVENYAGLSHEADGNQPITDDITPIRETRINGMTGYTYTVTSIGVSNHIFLDHEEENMVLHIIYTAPDPTDQGFQGTVDQMLDTLTLI